ncbi:MAG: LysR family transcriptional regulator [Rhizobiaceae bacterium]
MLPPRLSKADIHLLYVFAVVAEAKSFAAAQAVLNTSPSTISRQISDLEKRLGASLCQRGRSGFQLTNFGQRVANATDDLFNSLEQFSNKITGGKINLSGKLSIGVIDNWISNSQAPIVSALSKFHEQAPSVEIDIHSMAPDTIEYSLLENRIDIGIGVFHRPKQGLQYKKISREYIDLFCGEAHPLINTNRTISIDTKLEQSNLVRRAYLIEEQIAPIASRIKSTSQAHQVEGVAMLILTGKFIGYLPESYAMLWVREGKMKSVASKKYRLPTDIQLVTRRGHYQTRPSELFIKILKQKSDLENSRHPK